MNRAIKHRVQINWATKVRVLMNGVETYKWVEQQKLKIRRIVLVWTTVVTILGSPVWTPNDINIFVGECTLIKLAFKHDACFDRLGDKKSLGFKYGKVAFNNFQVNWLFSSIKYTSFNRLLTMLPDYFFDIWPIR